MAQNLDLNNDGIRRAIIQEIKGEENKNRRAESLRAFEIDKGRQGKFIVDKLEDEFSIKTVREMRKILSVNLCPRIINEQASVYNTAPSRVFANASETEQMQIDALYKYAKADAKYMQSNRYFKLTNQCAVQIVPRDGKIQMRVLLPHQFDVIPDANDPEKAYAYVVSVFDKYEYLQDNSGDQPANPSRNPYRSPSYNDGINQGIADADDYKEQLERYEVWTKDLNFLMDGKGNILSEDTVNPIGELPFVDIAIEKDFEFWVRTGNGVVDFAVDFGAQLSDVANIIKLQGYAQAVISAEKQPDSMTVGPNHILFMQLDANRPELKPTFEFVNPGSDLAGSLEFLEMSLRLFLTSNGIDPKTVSGKGDGQSYSSGIERLLALVDRFQASKGDIEIFRYVEEEVFKLLVKWSNAYQGTGLLIPELNGGQISDQFQLNVSFVEPQALQTKIEKEDSVIKLLDKGLITKEMALMEVHGIDEEAADEMLMELAEESAIKIQVNRELIGEETDDGEENVSAEIQ